MGIKAVRTGAMSGTAGANRRPVLPWLTAKREGARLRSAIEAAGLTQKAVAARLGVNVPWLQFRLKAKTLLTAEEAERIEQAIKGEGGQ